MINILNRTPLIKKITLHEYNKATNNQIGLKLKNISKRNTRAVFLNMLTIKAGLTRAEELTNQILHFKQEKRIPFFTFGEESVLGPSLLVLLSGDEVYVDKNTLLGLFEFTAQKYNFTNYLNEKKYDLNLVKKGEHKIRLNPFEPVKEQDEKWMKDILVKRKELFLNTVHELRKKKLKVSREELSHYLKSGILKPKTALEIGLIDGLESYDTFHLKNFEEKIVNARISPFDTIKAFKTELDQNMTSFINSALSDISIPEIVDEIETSFITQFVSNNLKTEYNFI